MQNVNCLCNFCRHTIKATDTDFPTGVPVNGFLCKGCEGEKCQAPQVVDGKVIFKKKEKAK